MSDGPAGVIFEVDEDSVITGVDYTLRSFRLWNPKLDEGERPMDGVVEVEQRIEGRRQDPAVFGDRVLTYDVPGQILLAGGAIIFNQPFALRAWIQAGGDVLIDRAGWGQIKGQIEVLATVAGRVGDYLDLEAPHQVNALVGQSPVAQRGGTRKVQIIGRTEKAGTSVLQLLDAGNVAQSPPDTPDTGGSGADPNDGIPVPVLSLAASADAPLTIATVTVTNVADLTPLNADVYLEYLVQTATPAGTDAGTAWGPVRTSEGTDELDLPAIPSGSTIWARGSTSILATGQRSAWSAWADITLGPASNGGDPSTPTPTLALSYTVDSTTGEVDVLATTNGGSVKFAAAATEADLEASDAAVRAATADTSAPFQALNIVTLAAGESRVISAFAYSDPLLNESIKVSIRARRPGGAGGQRGVGATFDGNGRELSTDITTQWVSPSMPYAGTLAEWELTGVTGPGSCVVTVEKCASGGYPGSFAAIDGGTDPAISGGHSAVDGTLTGWTTAIALGDRFRFTLSSATTFTQVTIFLEITPS